MLLGYELVTKQIERAFGIRDLVNTNPQISKYFHVLTTEELIPGEYRGDNHSYEKKGWDKAFLYMADAWQGNEVTSYIDICIWNLIS